MKAVSAMIATVLLIAFTIAVGGILSVWLSNLTISQTTTVSSGTDKQVKCSASALRIAEVRYPTGVGRSSVNVSVIYDSGTESLSNITVEITARGITDLVNSTGTVTPGEARPVNVTANYPPEVVSARGFCQNTVPIVGTCKIGQPCMIGSG